MLALLPSRRLSNRALLVTSAAVVAAMIGCGGGADTGNSGGATGAGAAASSNSTGTGKGGDGGTLFMFSSATMGEGGGGTGGTSTTGTTSGSTTTTMMPVCDGNPTTGPGKWAVKNGDDAQGQYGQAVAADANGNVYVTGSYNGNFSLGGITAEKQNATTTAMFVAKLNASGVAQWVHGYGATPPPGNGVPRAVGRAIGADDQGNSYVLGDVTGVMPIGSPAVASTGGFFGDSFIAKYDTNGTLMWAKHIGETPTGNPNGAFGTQAAFGLAVHKVATGAEILVGGSTQGKVDFDNGTSLTANSMASAAAYIAVFRSGDGSTKLALAFGDGQTDQTVRGVAWAPNGDILVTGSAAGPVQFPGGVTVTPAGTKGAFVARLKGDGSSTLWAKIYGSGSAAGNGVAADANGNVIVVGDHKGDIDLGGGVLSNNFGDNVFVARLDAAGNHIWSHSYGDSVAQSASGVTVDGMGRAIITGEYRGQIDFGGGALVANGNDQNAYVVKLDTHGCQVWAKSIGDSEYQSAKNVAVDATGNVSVVGAFKGVLTFGGVTLTGPSSAAEDIFVAQFAP